MPRRKREMIHGETRLLSEWLMQTYPNDRWSANVKLGADIQPKTGLVLDESEKRMFAAYKRYADAVVITQSEILVIEAKMFNPVEAVGPLLQYIDLVKHTPELREFAGRAVVGILLSAIDDAVAAAICARLHLRFIAYSPPWLQEFFAIYPFRMRWTPRTGSIDL